METWGVALGKVERGLGEGGSAGGEAFVAVRTISNPAYEAVRWLIQVQEPCTGDILQPLSKSSLCSNSVGAIL